MVRRAQTTLAGRGTPGNRNREHVPAESQRGDRPSVLWLQAAEFCQRNCMRSGFFPWNLQKCTQPGWLILIFTLPVSSWIEWFSFFFELFIYLSVFGCAGSSLLRGLSLAAVSVGYPLLQRVGFSFCWLLLLPSTNSRCVDFSSCGSRAPEQQAQWLRCMDSVAPRRVGSSQTRDLTRVSCIGRWILYHRATREALSGSSFLHWSVDMPGSGLAHLI